jgi:3-oxoacyl-[acyl-carrier protein] reductase
MARDALDEPGALDRITRTMPMRKVGTAEDVARTIVALASDRISGHVTGQVVTVAGGMEGRVLHD